MKTSDRTITLLRLFTLSRPEWTVEDAARETGLTVSTAYRYFRTLTEHGFICSYATGKYVLGPAFMKYDRQIRILDPLLTAAGPVMEEIARDLPPATMLLLCKLYDMEVMCIDQRRSAGADFASSYERGRPMPLHLGAASKVILAQLPSRAARKLYDREPAQMASAGLGQNWESFSQSLRTIRNGRAFATQGELHAGMQGIAVPILSGARQPLGSIATVRASGSPSETTEAIKTLLIRAADRIAETLRS